ncbi:MAG: Rpn family recombination-promoting nuclease/putative transposase [Prevotellaceae bacterium]|jgi:predicted transposase/invertase (TIGR01784 family)|nr:Rpn family recombination-promoting nuclease/putative transposase [Prevotellaceae bacterium]
MSKSNYIRFDWAIKRLFRQKSNFVVFEGFLSCLLDESMKINKILESEGNKSTFDDKFNRVDVLVENSKGELVIVEVQNNRELDYFHRMLYGVSKVVTEYISEGEPYSKVKKIYSINIVYFDLGQGKDYVYHGKTEFRGMHDNDILQLSEMQKKQFKLPEISNIFPEYYLLCVNGFDRKALTPLDEWISFLKTGDIPDNAQAQGLPEARERLKRDNMSKTEQQEYDAHLEALRYQSSVIDTNIKIGIEKGREEGKAAEKIEIAKNLLQIGLSVSDIAKGTGLTEKQILEIVK